MQKGNLEGARIHAENAIRQKNQVHPSLPRAMEEVVYVYVNHAGSFKWVIQAHLIIDRVEEGLETEVPSKYHPCISAILIEA